MARLFSVSWTCNFYGFFAFYITAQTGYQSGKLALDQWTESGKYMVVRKTCLHSDQESYPGLETITNPPLHDLLSPFALKDLYIHLAWSNYGLNVSNIVQTYQGKLACVCKH